MTSVKNIYIYLLSIRKLIFQSIKEFFFSTNFYSKFLDSKVPEGLFFYPNPYLLSPLLNHKDQLIKISSEDLRNFRVSILSDKEKKNFTTEAEIKKNINNPLILLFLYSF